MKQTVSEEEIEKSTHNTEMIELHLYSEFYFKFTSNAHQSENELQCMASAYVRDASKMTNSAVYVRRRLPCYFSSFVKEKGKKMKKKLERSERIYLRRSLLRLRLCFTFLQCSIFTEMFFAVLFAEAAENEFLFRLHLTNCAQFIFIIFTRKKRKFF